MAGKRAKDLNRVEEQKFKAESQSAVLVARAGNAADTASGESDSLWIWELED